MAKPRPRTLWFIPDSGMNARVDDSRRNPNDIALAGRRRIKAGRRHGPIGYKVVLAKDGTYAVQSTSRTGHRALTISGFATEDEARRWIEDLSIEETTKE